MQTPGKDRRRAQRYPLRFEFQYRSFHQGDAVTVGDGTTLNISSQGVLVRTNGSLVQGETIELTIDLFRSRDVEHTVMLILLGHVVRADADGSAIRILRHGFYRRDSAEAAPGQILAG